MIKSPLINAGLDGVVKFSKKIQIMEKEVSETIPMQIVQVPAYGRTFTFEIPLEEEYTPLLEDETQSCVLVNADGDVYQALEIML